MQAWLGRGLLARLLWPASCLYRVLWAGRGLAYRQGWLASRRLPVPVVVVGNVVVGGAGKTPTGVALVQHLQARGWHPGIISRGHGRHPTGSQPATPFSDAADVGDEPVLLARATGVPVWVGRDRPAAGQALLAAHPDVDILVSDDGMQHWALRRDLTLVLFDARGTGNGWLLPAGPLREPWPTRAWGGGPLIEVHTAPLRRLSGQAVSPTGQRRALQDWAQAGQPVGALAGIAQPNAFFAMLRERGLQVPHTRALPDHASAEVLWAALAQADRHLPWLCTEKDAVKLFPRLVGHPDAPEVWAVPLEQSLPDGVLQAIDQALDGLSSRHGHQTA